MKNHHYLEGVSISRVTEYTPDIAAGIGALLPRVWEGFDGAPIAREVLEFIINSPERDQFIATKLGRVIGMANVTLHISPSGSEGWLTDFVTSPDPTVRGQGVGRLLFEEVLKWCDDRSVGLGFTAKDPATHPIYEALGATQDFHTTRFSVQRRV